MTAPAAIASLHIYRTDPDRPDNKLSPLLLLALGSLDGDVITGINGL